MPPKPYLTMVWRYLICCMIDNYKNLSQTADTQNIVTPFITEVTIYVFILVMIEDGDKLSIRVILKMWLVYDG